jgi:hypothetical protein
MLEESLSKLSPNLRGSVITPASGEYEAARKVYNAMIDRRPDAIVRCANVADVRATVNFARLKFGQQLPTLHSTMHFYPVDGAASRVDRHETAFSYRDAKWSMVIVGVDPEPVNVEKITAWTKEYWEALHPYSMGGAYVNFMMEEGIDRIKAT